MEIYAEGPEHAKIMLIGEAWGKDEEIEKRPFIGRAGKVLDGILDEVGIPRALCRITNVIHERPANNNFGVYYEDNKPSAKLLQAYDRLNNEIASCQPNVIVPLGNEALKAVMGLDGISNWRGSILVSKAGYKVIPAYHPAAVARDWLIRPCTVTDFLRIAKESEYAQRKQTPRETITNPSLQEIRLFIERAKSSEWLSVDIETESNQITCVGLSASAGRAICIPFWFGGSGCLWTEDDEKLIWGMLKELLESDSPKKITQNGVYDREFLFHTVGIDLKIHFDTMLAFHLLYSELPASLAYLTSVLTDQPYYKYMRRTDSMDTLWTYNGLDAMLTYECAMKLLAELEEERMLKFYYDYVHALIDPLFSMSSRGVLIDIEKKKALKVKLNTELAELQKALDKFVGYEININSHNQMVNWLYFELGLPKKTKRLTTPRSVKRLAKKVANSEELTPLQKWEYENKTLSLTSDEDALLELYRTTKNEALNIVIEMRERYKLLSTYLEVKLDDDNRIRCTYNIAGTETGRLSSSATAFGTGTNLQNIPDGEIRSLFIADQGYIFINADLSQAEARVVAFLAEDQRLLSVFETGGDIHKKNASRMFNVKESEVTKDQRFLAKRAVHGLNYGMGYVTFAKECGIDLTMAKRVYNSYFATFPRLKVWHMLTRSMLQKSRILTTPFGRRRLFFNAWSDSLLKEGLAYIPQSTVAEIVNQGIIKLWKAWQGQEDKQLLLQVHDSILVQVKPELVDSTVDEIREALTHPLEIHGKIMTIPVDFKIGYNWGDMEVYKHEETAYKA